MAGSMVLFIRSNHVSFDRVAEFREAIEGAATALAARRATPQGVDGLKEILQRSRAVLEQDPTDWRGHYKFDEQLHVAIAEMSENPMFIAALSSVHLNILDEDDQFAPKSPALLWENYLDLTRIVEAVESGDADAAAQAAREHVRSFNGHMKEQLAMQTTGSDDAAATED
jgi:DNA-binding FadR family transcriptional regulator